MQIECSWAFGMEMAAAWKLDAAGFVGRCEDAEDESVKPSSRVR